MCPGVCSPIQSRPASWMTWLSLTRTVGTGVLKKRGARLAARIRIRRLNGNLWPSPPHGGGSHGRRRPAGAAASSVLDVDVRRFVAIPDHPEALVGDDLGAGLGPHPAGPAEVVGMAVGHDHGVHPPQRDAGAGESLGQLGERTPPGQSGVDDGDAARVLEDVAVDVAEAGHVDRQLGTQDARGDLGDLGRGALLLLATGAIAHRAMVRGRRHQGRPRTTGVTSCRVVRSLDDSLGSHGRALRRSAGGMGPLRRRLVDRLAAAVVEPSSARTVHRRPATAGGRRPGARRGGRAAPVARPADTAAAARTTSWSSSTTTRPTTPRPSPRRSGPGSSPRHHCPTAGSASRTPARPAPRRRRRARSSSSTPTCARVPVCSTASPPPCRPRLMPWSSPCSRGTTPSDRASG